MSLPDEYVKAQERIINYFIQDKVDRKLWPKHLINGIELKMLFEDHENLRKENERMKKAIKSFVDIIIEYEKEIEEANSSAEKYDEFFGTLMRRTMDEQ